MTWAARYATHLGLLPQDFRPQFLETLGTEDPAMHIRYAADLGFAGVQYTWPLERPPEEVALVRAALAETGLECGLIAGVPFNEFLAPIWTDRSAVGRQKLAGYMLKAAVLAASLGSAGIVTLIGSDPERQDEASQCDDVAANLRDVASIAADFGLVVGVEAMAALPNMLLRTTSAAVELMKTADHPSIGIVYDAPIVAMTDGELLPALRLAQDLLVRVQIADLPGRVEPGAGELTRALQDVVVEAISSGYAGVVDLEHGWLEPGKAGEQAGLERLRQFDEGVRSLAGLAHRE
jgi:hydroxypyruvate isomerase